MSSEVGAEALRRLLAIELPGCTVRAPDGPLVDISGHDLGLPAAIVRPQRTADVVALVRIARRLRVPLVVVGEQTAYWRPLDVAGALVLDPHDLAQIDPIDALGSATWCGAGASVRDVDDALRRHCRCLAAHPDAFGDTTIGAMVATGMASGVGMAAADVSQMVAGLEVVLGTGDVLRTGAAAVLGAPPFSALGLPDPTGLLLASDGALGVVTRVAIRSVAVPLQAQLTADFDDLAIDDVATMLRSLRLPHHYDTLRAVREQGQPQGAKGAASAGWLVDVRVGSPADEAELLARVEAMAAALAAQPGCREVRRCGPTIDGRPVWQWQGPRGEHRQRLHGLRFGVVDVHLGWADLAAALTVGRGVVRAAESLPHRSLRLAVYAAPDHVNVGVHMAFAGADEAAILALLRDARAAFALLPIVPYRWGREWGEHLAERVDPTYLAFLRTLKALWDPDGVLHPGAGLWGAA